MFNFFFFFSDVHGITSIQTKITIGGAMVLLHALYVSPLLECCHATRPFIRIELKAQSFVFASFDKELAMVKISVLRIKLAPHGARKAIF